MAVVLSDISAALYWEACDSRASHFRRVRSLDHLVPPDANASSYIESAFPFFADDRVHYLVGSQSERQCTNRITCHSTSAMLPAGSFCQVEGGLHVVAPELSFVQMARYLSLEQLVHYGMMLCGIYFRTPISIGKSGNEQGTKRRIGQRTALTSLEDLNAYVLSAPHLFGTRKAKKALRHIIDNSRSPMESSLAVSLCLPYRLGGCSMPKPSMNMPVYVDPKGVLAGGVRWDLHGNPYFECDLVWTEQRAIVEYHGDESHFGKEGVAKDVRKANLLRASGYSYYAVTSEIFSSSLKFWEFATKLTKDLKHRIQPGVADFKKRNEGLRKMLRIDYLQACRRSQCVRR